LFERAPNLPAAAKIQGCGEEQIMGEDALKKIDPGRRAFLKKLIAGAAFATPMLLSFSGTGFGLGQARADSGNGGEHGYGHGYFTGYGHAYGHYGDHDHPDNNGYCASDKQGGPGSHAPTISMTGGGIVTGDAGPVHLGFHLSDVQGPDNEIELNWKDASGEEHSFHARCFAAAFDTSSPDYVIALGPDGGAGQAPGSLDRGAGLLEWGFLAFNNGDPGLTFLLVLDDAGQQVLQVYGPLARGAFTVHRMK
jgi:hypothetical protein